MRQAEHVKGSAHTNIAACTNALGALDAWVPRSDVFKVGEKLEDGRLTPLNSRNVANDSHSDHRHGVKINVWGE